MGRRWMEDMGLQWRDMPNFDVHRQADEEHSDMFLPFLSELATGEKEKVALAAVKESLSTCSRSIDTASQKKWRRFRYHDRGARSVPT